MSLAIHGWSKYLCNSKNSMDSYVVLQKGYPCHCNNDAHGTNVLSSIDNLWKLHGITGLSFIS